MGGRQARQLCPHAIVVSPRIRRLLRSEQGGVRGVRRHHAARRRALDRRGLPRRRRPAPARRAARSRSPRGCGRGCASEVGLPITVGVARTKFLAKVASGVAKPDGLLVVRPDRELDFLHPLPVERLWGVGADHRAKLHDRGIDTVGEVAAPRAKPTLVSMLGPASGRHLHALAHNRDPRPVEVGRRRRSIGSQRALGSRRRAPGEIDATLAGLVDRVDPPAARRRPGRSHGRAAPALRRLRSRATRSHTLPRPTPDTEPSSTTARGLLADGDR